MCKTAKASLGTLLIKEVTMETVRPTERYVLDGGALLHRVKWKGKGTYKDVAEQYSKYITSKYDKCTVVFNSYSSGPSIKDHEHERRKRKSAADIKLCETMTAHPKQHEFLANDRNKSQFIDLLKQRLSRDGHNVKQSEYDADTLIVKSALDLAHSGYVTTVVADDTDILVLLLHHYRSTDMADIFLLSEAAKRQRQGIKFINVRRLVNVLGQTLMSHLLFIHGWSGRDTTSTFFNQGKTAILRKLEKSEEVQGISRLFNCSNVTQEQVAEAGLRLFDLMYQGKSEDSLNRLRYARYMHLISDSVSKIKPEILPPTERAAHFHYLQVYLQVTQWKHLMAAGINPLQWGWKQVEDKFVPLHSV